MSRPSEIEIPDLSVLFTRWTESTLASKMRQRAENWKLDHHPTRILWDLPVSAVFITDMCGRKQRRISRRSPSDTSDLF